MIQKFNNRSNLSLRIHARAGIFGTASPQQAQPVAAGSIENDTFTADQPAPKMKRHIFSTLLPTCLALLLIAANCEPPKKFTLQSSGSGYTLKEEGLPDKAWKEAEGGVTRLSKGDDGSLVLSAVDLGGVSRAQWVDAAGREAVSMSVDAFLLSGQHSASGKCTYTVGSRSGTALVSDCEDFYLYHDARSVRVLLPTEPVRITYKDDSLVFQRKHRWAIPFWNRETGANTPFYLVNCPEVTTAGSSNIVVGGGIGVTILVDNIIDPDAGGGGSELPDLIKGLDQFKWEQAMKARAQCVGFTDPRWDGPALVTIDPAAGGYTLELRCNRYLRVVAANDVHCIDIQACGAKILLDADKGLLEIRSGCPDNPTVPCP